MFTTQNSADYGPQWLNYLFQGTAFLQGNVFGGAIQQALQTMLAIYSDGILIVASFLLLYHLLQMIAETAHTGKAGGRANQIWAPIRLVFAIGLLVPIAGGLNIGQNIALQVAQWGSNFASYSWTQFYQTFENVNLVQSQAPTPDVATVIGTMYSDAFCLAAYNVIARDAPGFSVPAPTVNPPSVDLGSGTTLGPGAFTEDFNVTYQGTVLTRRCGDIVYAPPQCTGGTTAGNCSTISNIQQAQAKAIQQEFSQIQQEMVPFAEYLIPGGNNYQGVGTSCPAGSPATCTAVAASSLPSNQMVLQDVANYQKLIASNLTPPSATVQSASATDPTTTGWMSAGILFNSIAAQQATYYHAAGNLPSVESPNISDGPDSAMVLNGNMALVKWITTPQSGLQLSIQNETPPNDSSDFGKIMSALERGGEDAKIWSSDGFFNNILNSSGAVSQQDAISSLTDLGRRMMTVSFGLFGSGAASAIGGSWLMKGVGSLLRKVGGAAVPVGGAVAATSCLETLGVGCLAGGAIALGGGALSSIGDLVHGAADKVPIMVAGLLFALATAILIPAIMLGYVLPLLPFTKFLFGIMTWLVSVLQAVFGIPLFALAHLNPDGEHFLPQSARHGYFLLLQIFVRPIMMVFGLIGAILIMNSVVGFMNSFYVPAVLLSYTSDTPGIFGKLVYTILYCALAYGIVTSSLKLIDIVPDNAIKWLGGAHMDSHFQEQHLSPAATAIGGSQLIGATTRAFEGIGTAINDKLREPEAKEAAARQRISQLAADYQKNGNQTGITGEQGQAGQNPLQLAKDQYDREQAFLDQQTGGRKPSLGQIWRNLKKPRG